MSRPKFIRTDSPAPGAIRALRDAHNLSRHAAASLIHVSASTWEAWEAGRNPMPAGLWELFGLKLRKGEPCSQSS